MGAEFKPWTPEELAAWERACKSGTLLHGDPDFQPKVKAKRSQKDARIESIVDALMALTQPVGKNSI